MRGIHPQKEPRLFRRVPGKAAYFPGGLLAASRLELGGHFRAPRVACNLLLLIQLCDFIQRIRQQCVWMKRDIPTHGSFAHSCLIVFAHDLGSACPLPPCNCRSGKTDPTEIAEAFSRARGLEVITRCTFLPTLDSSRVERSS